MARRGFASSLLVLLLACDAAEGEPLQRESSRPPSDASGPDAPLDPRAIPEDPAVVDASVPASRDADTPASRDGSALDDAGIAPADAAAPDADPPHAGCPSSHADLSVHSIARTPRFEAAKVEYEPFGFNPRLSPASASSKLHPDPGDETTFTAHVVNQGDALSPPARYRFFVDGSVVARGEIPAIPPGASVDAAFTWAWQDGPHVVRIELDGGACGPLADAHAVNDALEQRTNAIMFTIYTWPGFERFLAEHENAVGTRSAADWIQLEAAEMNRLFETSRSELAPEGVSLRIAIDRIVLVPAGTPFPEGGAGAPEPCPTESCASLGGPENGMQEWLRTVDGQRDPLTMHLWAHQLGLVDVYRMNIRDSALEVTDWLRGVSNSNSDAGTDLRPLFDQDAATRIRGTPGEPLWFAFELSRSTSPANELRLWFPEGSTHRFRAYAGTSFAEVIARGVPVTEAITTRGGGEARVQVAGSGAAVDARAWLVEVERLDDGPPTVLDWQLWIRSTRNAASRFPIGEILERVRLVDPRGPIVPNVDGDVVRYASVRDDLMNVGMPYSLDPWTAWALNTDARVDGRDLPLRRGWFGRYLSFVPTRNAVVLTHEGDPVANATVEIFQQQPVGVADSVLPDVPKLVGRTDERGRFELPGTTTAAYARHVGRSQPIEVSTPFSTIESPDPNVLGTSSVLLMRVVDLAGNRWFAFLDVAQFNVEYARGNVELGTYEVELGEPSRPR